MPTVLTVVLGALVIGLLAGAVVMGLKKAPPAPAPDRDLCVHGCHTVHSVRCEHGTIIDGLPLYCERAYGHGGNHEADFGGGTTAFWPQREEWRGHVVDHNGPPFKKMIL